MFNLSLFDCFDIDSIFQEILLGDYHKKECEFKNKRKFERVSKTKLTHMKRLKKIEKRTKGKKNFRNNFKR